MKIKSLGRQTDLIFANFNGKVIDRGHYTLIQTPSNPGYHWGNYIIFDEAPKEGDLVKWKQLFDREFPYYQEPHHYVFTWDLDGVKGETQDFLQDGFDFDSSKVLTAHSLVEPKYLNTEIQVRKIQTDEEWEAVVKLQTLCSDPKYRNEYYDEFKRKQMENYRHMSEAGKGYWFGAFLDGKLVGDLGVFYEGKVARYQSVGTDPEYRRRGICATLVYQCGQLAFDEYGVDCLVMEADPDYHAARIYESVGFRQTEINHSVSWWKR